jgi:hypothetical protein
MLFNIFTNDLPDIFDHSKTDPVQLDTKKLNCLLYADDLVLLSESGKGLHSCLEQLNSYCSKWKLKINISKTKIIIFSKGKRKWSNFRFMINDQKIEVVEKYKYLGVIGILYSMEHMLFGISMTRFSHLSKDFIFYF